MSATHFSSLEHWLLARVQRSIGRAPIEIVLGREDANPGPAADSPPRVRILDRGAFFRMLLDPEIGFGDGYMQGRIEVEGDLLRALELTFEAMHKARARTWYGNLLARWLSWTQDNSLRGSAANIHRHYDLSNDFYSLWLDTRMIYTCAYFPKPGMTLEEAQLAKMDHVCRKVRLEPGEKVIEAGCGWGALAIHMAKHYGASVRAFNISSEQIAYARERAKKEGVSRRVEFIEDDYRNISGHCDVFMSVGMLEHVGAHHYAEFRRVIQRTMDNSGRGLLHFIGRNQPRPFSSWIRKQIFPGAYAPALSDVAEIFEPANYSVLDVENLRLHYARTLEHWLARFERSKDKVREMFGENFVRAWRLYLAGSIAAFKTNSIQLFQIVFAGPDFKKLPWTRAHLYEQNLQDAPEKESRWIRAMS